MKKDQESINSKGNTRRLEINREGARQVESIDHITARTKDNEGGCDRSRLLYGLGYEILNHVPGSNSYSND